MDPSTVLLVLGALVKYGPKAVRQILFILQKKDPVTHEDWQKVLDVVETPLHPEEPDLNALSNLINKTVRSE